MTVQINLDAQIAEMHLRAYPNEEINDMPLRKWEGETRVIRNNKQLDWALARMESEPLLGFDTETRPVFKKGHTPGPPNLLQLATVDRVFVIQLQHVGLDNGLAELLGNKNIIKSGVAVHDDLVGLKKLCRFTPQSFVDLGQISQQVNMQTHGLRNLAANLLGFRVSKSAQCSNWARDPLSHKQVIYAATDAWISRELFIAFQKLGIL
ncbi:3'-5' exonuclease [Paucidesulfovibrio gracilis DSM 16080]|uniref:3'-5' exonuclease n=1 Tax=Paucidesulfovibrio gracilis DSM 16080 TaxID=1121449 RepID=A0A1T4W5H0_9BACT|nr:3'-5' exonuclease [Paucidesulfovibrio gracilis]SKA72298.1 3'-5' exonuclease [Paucidesulfovibrio gracilis DSM 16080]